MLRNIAVVCATIATLAVVYFAAVRLASAQGTSQSAPPRAIVQSGGNGRFQIVNPTPERAMNIMLLDTVTGKTWQMCGGNAGAVSSWCLMERSD